MKSGSMLFPLVSTTKVVTVDMLSAADLDEIAPGGGSLADRLARLATLAWESGCDGLVCSAADLPALRRAGAAQHPDVR